MQLCGGKSLLIIKELFIWQIPKSLISNKPKLTKLEKNKPKKKVYRPSSSNWTVTDPGLNLYVLGLGNTTKQQFDQNSHIYCKLMYCLLISQIFL